jgi:hypothetical protein
MHGVPRWGEPNQYFQVGLSYIPSEPPVGYITESYIQVCRKIGFGQIYAVCMYIFDPGQDMTYIYECMCAISWGGPNKRVINVCVGTPDIWPSIHLIHGVYGRIYIYMYVNAKYVFSL